MTLKGQLKKILLGFSTNTGSFLRLVENIGAYLCTIFFLKPIVYVVIKDYNLRWLYTCSPDGLTTLHQNMKYSMSYSPPCHMLQGFYLSSQKLVFAITKLEVITKSRIIRSYQPFVQNHIPSPFWQSTIEDH